MEERIEACACPRHFTHRLSQRLGTLYDAMQVAVHEFHNNIELVGSPGRVHDEILKADNIGVPSKVPH